MAKKQGIVEIRLDRRQAFYAVVGFLLLMSVAFVVGLIFGQRMQLPDDLPEISARFEQVGGQSPTLSGGQIAEQAANEPTEQGDHDDAYTFYEGLADEPADGRRPRPVLLLEPEVRAMEREQSEVAAQTATNRDDDSIGNDGEGHSNSASAAVEPPATATAPVEAASAPEAARDNGREVLAARTPSTQETDVRGDGVRRIQRRSVARVATSESAASQTAPARAPASDAAAPDEAGFFTVETGRFESFGQANEQRRRLQDAGHDAIVTIVGAADGRRYRVQVGSFTRRSDARGLADQLAGQGLTAQVVREG